MLSGGWKLSENSFRQVEKRSVGGSKIASRSPSEGCCTPGGAHLAAKAARKPNLDGSGGVLGALLAAPGGGLGLPGPSPQAPGRLQEAILGVWVKNTLVSLLFVVFERKV